MRSVAAGGDPVLTYALIGICVVTFIGELAGGASATGGGLGTSKLFVEGALRGSDVADGDYWRLLTAGFLHASFFHLAVNMYSLYYVGTIMEQVIGRWRFLLLYLASGLAGSAGALVLSPLTPTVGASGAIFGVLGGLFILERRRHIATGGQVAGLIVLNLVITFAFRGSISVGGHVGVVDGTRAAGIQISIDGDDGNRRRSRRFRLLIL